MECIPRKGDMITVFDGWGSEEVQRVWWDIEKQEVEIDIHPDWTGEYKKHVETLKENKEGEQ